MLGHCGSNWGYSGFIQGHSGSNWGHGGLMLGHCESNWGHSRLSLGHSGLIYTARRSYLYTLSIRFCTMSVKI